MKATNKVILMAVVLILVLATAACGLGGINFSGNGATINVSMDENQLNDLFERSTNEVHTGGEIELLDEVTSVDMHDGYVTVYGKYTRPDGSKGDGSYDASLTAEDGALKAQITDVNIEGLSMDDPRIAEMNERIARELAQSASESEGEVEFREVTVTEDHLEMEIRVNFQR